MKQTTLILLTTLCLALAAGCDSETPVDYAPKGDDPEMFDGKFDNYFSTHSQEFFIEGVYTIALSSTDDPTNEDRIKERVSQQYEHINKLVSAQLKDFDAYVRGFSFETITFEVADRNVTFTFKAEVTGPFNLMQRLTLDADNQFVVKMHKQPQTLGFHEWYDFDEKLAEGAYDADMLVDLTLKIRPEARSQNAYPEYDELFKDGVLDMAIFFGYDSESGWGMRACEKFYKRIAEMGFDDPTNGDFEKLTAEVVFTRSFTYKGEAVEARLRIFNEKTPNVKDRFIEALANVEILDYDGHSNYGGGYILGPGVYFSDYDFDRAAGIMNPDMYQIIFMASCHSASYYSDKLYLKFPRTTKTLDIFTTVNPASYSDAEFMDVTFIKSLMNTNDLKEHQPLSYEEILMEMNHGLNSPALIGLHGIDDNPQTHPISGNELGQTIEGEFADMGEQDRYPVTLRAGDTLEVGMMGSDNKFDSYLRLLGPDGTELVHDDDGGIGRNSLIRGFKAQSDGEYTIVADSYDGQSTGRYFLTYSVNSAN